MTPGVAVVGAGGIGARHLQGLARLARPVDVHVVDPSRVARERADSLFREAGAPASATVRYHESLTTLPPVELAIVATNARERAAVVQGLVRAGARRLLLEKVLFTRVEEYETVERELTRNGIPAWVNCARHAFPRARALAALIDGRPFTYDVEGAGWGLGCNLIHHLEEAAMLAGSLDVQLRNDALAPSTIPAKRAGYIEFLGTVSGSVGECCGFSATCTDGTPGDRWVTIRCGGTELRVSQAEQTLTITSGAGSRVEPFPMPLQSEITALHVAAILDGKAPDLPDYAAAATLHIAMLGTFLDHLRRTAGDSKIEECAIT